MISKPVPSSVKLTNDSPGEKYFNLGRLRHPIKSILKKISYFGHGCILLLFPLIAIVIKLAQE